MKRDSVTSQVILNCCDNCQTGSKPPTKSVVWPSGPACQALYPPSMLSAIAMAKMLSCGSVEGCSREGAAGSESAASYKRGRSCAPYHWKQERRLTLGSGVRRYQTTFDPLQLSLAPGRVNAANKAIPTQLSDAGIQLNGERSLTNWLYPAIHHPRCR